MTTSISKRWTMLACLMFALTACGGGSGSNEGQATGANPSPTTPPSDSEPPTTPPSPPPGPSADELSAQNAKLRIIQDRYELRVHFLDLFDNEHGFQLEQRIYDGSWQAIETVAAGNGDSYEWLVTVQSSGFYRVVALLDDRPLPLHTALNETQILIDVGFSPMTIAIDQTEPVQGDLQVSMQNAGPAQSVTYLLDHIPIAQSTSGETFTATLPAQQLLDGTHTLTARVQKSESLSILQHRQLQIFNPQAAILLGVFDLETRGATQVRMIARATSYGGVASVAFFANDELLSVETTPQYGDYVIRVDRTRLPSGPNVFRAVVTERDGATVSMEQHLTIDHFPSLDVSGPFDGMIASNGRIDVQAAFGDDMPGATLTIAVGERRIVQTQTSPLIGSYSLSDIAAGEHTVVVRVRDISGQVDLRAYQLIVPSVELTYELIATGVRHLLGTGDGSLLYEKHSTDVVFRSADGVETPVPLSPEPTALSYQFTAGRYVGRFVSTHMNVIDASGQSTDLTPTSDLFAHIEPDLHGSWVSWTPSGQSMFMFHNLSTGQTTSVPSAGPMPIGYRHDLLGAPGAERLLYAATIDGTPGIYSRDLAGNATELLIGGNNYDVQTDGTRVMWRQDIDDQNQPLMTAPLSNPTASMVMSSRIDQSFLENGLNCWLDGHRVLHVNDGTVSTALAENIGTISGYTLKDGFLIYPDGGQMHVWTRTGGERVWLDTLTREAVQADGVAYFLTGIGTLYRVHLP